MHEFNDSGFIILMSPNFDDLVHLVDLFNNSIQK